MSKRIRFVSICLWLTVLFPLYGQGRASIHDLPENWHPDSPFLYNPDKQYLYSLAMPHDSATYQPRNLIRLPFIIVRKIEVAKDWSTISLTGKLIGKSYTMPFVAPVDWYFKKQIRLNRQLAFEKAIRDTSRVRTSQGQILQDRRGRGIEVIGMDLGNIGRGSGTDSIQD